MNHVPVLHRKKLPIGIQSFTVLREEGPYYYVDKTPIALDLIRNGRYYFLSRPRRFGKSLFLDTLAALFEGQHTLFKGLYAEHAWDWTQKHPVIRISFGDGVLQSRAELQVRMQEILLDNQERLGLRCTHTSLSGQLSQLIALAHAQFEVRLHHRRE
jgi:hypothetical protein